MALSPLPTLCMVCIDTHQAWHPLLTTHRIFPSSSGSKGSTPRPRRSHLSACSKRARYALPRTPPVARMHQPSAILRDYQSLRVSAVSGLSQTFSRLCDNAGAVHTGGLVPRNSQRWRNRSRCTAAPPRHDQPCTLLDPTSLALGVKHRQPRCTLHSARL